MVAADGFDLAAYEAGALPLRYTAIDEKKPQLVRIRAYVRFRRKKHTLSENDHITR